MSPGSQQDVCPPKEGQGIEKLETMIQSTVISIFSLISSFKLKGVRFKKKLRELSGIIFFCIVEDFCLWSMVFFLMEFVTSFEFSFAKKGTDGKS